MLCSGESLSGVTVLYIQGGYHRADFGSFVLGLISGLAPTLIWQMGLKPRRDRMNAAKMLRVEVKLNLRHLVAQRKWLQARPDRLLEDFRTYHVVFDALSRTVAEFRAPVVEAIIRAYEHLEQLRIVSERVRAYEQRLDEMEDDLEKDTTKRRKLSASIQAGVDAFAKSLDGAIDTLEHTRKRLHAWSEEPLTPLEDIESVEQQRVREVQQQRDYP